MPDFIFTGKRAAGQGAKPMGACLPMLQRKIKLPQKECQAI